MEPCVYLLASQKNGTLYLGVTSNLIQRVWQHREGSVEGFTQKYNVKVLVWYEQHATMESAITREKALKKWNRDWKLKLIEKTNPRWLDLWPEIIDAKESSRMTEQQVTTESRPATAHSLTTEPRHSRAGGNPGIETTHLDFRLRGNDDTAGEVV